MFRWEGGQEKMKYSIEKKNLALMRILRQDKEFHERALSRIDVDWDVILMVERQRVGMLKRKVENVNLVTGEIEFGNIIIVDGKIKPTTGNGQSN